MVVIYPFKPGYFTYLFMALLLTRYPRVMGGEAIRPILKFPMMRLPWLFKQCVLV
jgi:hypothetical protein